MQRGNPTADLSFRAYSSISSSCLKRKSLSGGALSRITSLFSTSAKSSAARGQLDFFLRNKFYTCNYF